ncbi:unnamed protein product [Staurois parvus]|uniref:Uncharacterized protein n=1 Tax=Staurois parvus TaxID=386267 RepID=A0ABN9CB28_9NEOB|nr:unnamed protein product [Staurois parvus]
MYINGRTGAVQERVDVYKWHPHPGSARQHDPEDTRNTDRCTGPLCEVLIM